MTELLIELRYLAHVAMVPERRSKELRYNNSMQESKFDQYLGHELKRLAFVSGGSFKIVDIKEHLMKSDREFLNRAYAKENPKVTWNWDSFADRMNRHVYRVVKDLGGARQKIRNRWVYKLSPNLLIERAPRINARKPLAYS